MNELLQMLRNIETNDHIAAKRTMVESWFSFTESKDQANGATPK